VAEPLSGIVPNWLFVTKNSPLVKHVSLVLSSSTFHNENTCIVLCIQTDNHVSSVKHRDWNFFCINVYYYTHLLVGTFLFKLFKVYRAHQMCVQRDRYCPTHYFNNIIGVSEQITISSPHKNKWVRL